ncbi:MAG TPA: hypothetical protein VNK94_02190 [Gaiellaceae bacterium]|nr:hypothetical protein [Gaiellaceae bacterium]
MAIPPEVLRFRAANEGLRRTVYRDAPNDRPLAFVCECEDPHCNDFVKIDLATLGSLRGDRQFVLLPAHHIRGGRRIARGRGYVIVAVEPEPLATGRPDARR